MPTKDPIKRRAILARYRKRHKKKLKEAAHKYITAHHEEWLERNRVYRKTNRDKLNITQRKYRKRIKLKLNHRKYNKTWTDRTLAQGLCPLCSQPRSERSRRYCEKHLKDARERMRIKRGFKRGVKAVSKLKREPVLASNWNEAQKFIQDNIDLFLDRHDPILDGAIPYEEYRTSMDDFSSQDWMD